MYNILRIYALGTKRVTLSYVSMDSEFGKTLFVIKRKEFQISEVPYEIQRYLVSNKKEIKLDINLSSEHYFIINYCEANESEFGKNVSVLSERFFKRFSEFNEISERFTDIDFRNEINAILNFPWNKKYIYDSNLGMENYLKLKNDAYFESKPLDYQFKIARKNFEKANGKYGYLADNRFEISERVHDPNERDQDIYTEEYYDDWLEEMYEEERKMDFWEAKMEEIKRKIELQKNESINLLSQKRLLEEEEHNQMRFANSKEEREYDLYDPDHLSEIREKLERIKELESKEKSEESITQISDSEELEPNTPKSFSEVTSEIEETINEAAEVFSEEIEDDIDLNAFEVISEAELDIPIEEPAIHSTPLRNLTGIEKDAYRTLSWFRSRNDAKIVTAISDFINKLISPDQFVSLFNSILQKDFSRTKNDEKKFTESIKGSIRRCYNELGKIPERLTLDERNTVMNIKQAYQNSKITPSIEIHNDVFDHPTYQYHRIKFYAEGMLPVCKRDIILSGIRELEKGRLPVYHAQSIRLYFHDNKQSNDTFDIPSEPQLVVFAGAKPENNSANPYTPVKFAKSVESIIDSIKINGDSLTFKGMQLNCHWVEFK